MNGNVDTKVITVTSEVPLPPSQSTEFHWGRRQVHALISKVEDFFEDFYDSTKKKKFIWNAVADQMQEEGFNCTGSECDKKWRNLKGTYVKVLQKQIHGDTGYRFEYFDALHHILGKEIDPLGMKEATHGEAPVIEVRSSHSDYHEIKADGDFVWTDLAVYHLLDLIHEHRNAIHSSSMYLDDAWMEVAKQMGLHGHNVQSEQCHCKWVNLQEGFQFHQAEAEASGSPAQWPFFERVKDIKKLFSAINSYRKLSSGDASSPRQTRGIRGRGSDVRRARRESEHLEVRDKSILGRVKQLETTYNISRRLELMESQVESARLQQDSYKRTNDILSQILSKLSKINNALEQEQHFQSNHKVQSVAHQPQPDQDSGSPNQGIIIVEAFADPL